MGDGSSPGSLSRASIWRLVSGAASFPTLFSTASGVFGLVAGPLSIPFSRTTELLSEAFQLASIDGCATGLRTRKRHVYDFLPASSPFSIGSATVFDSAFARCHGSRLLTLRLHFVHRSAVSFLTSPTLRKVFTGLAWTACPSRCGCSFCSAFRRFSFGRLRFFRRRQSHSPVLIHSSNRLPSGNCDSLRFETSLSYLIRLGTVSHRSSSLSSHFA